MKDIEAILPPPPPNMVGDGFRVHNFFPNGYRISRRTSPFFMLDFNPEIDFGPSDHPRGVGVHPHRGFETVTIIHKGAVAHHDSAGNSGVIGPGDVQWMTAGSGVLHKEYHEAEFSKTGGPFQMVQLWVNLPKIHKMTPPKYQTLQQSMHGLVRLDPQGSEVRVIAGEFDGIKGSASTFTPMQVWDMRLRKDKSFRFDLPEHYNTLIVAIEGKLSVQQQVVNEHHLVLFKNQGTEIMLEALEDCTLLVLSGEPIDEPVFHYGPFLMNTAQDIQQAIDDLNAGKFGVLED